MEENKENEIQEQGYEPRPARQVWSARIGLVFMIAFVIYQLLAIATGGR
mgnify:CR=1 FL=1